MSGILNADFISALVTGWNTQTTLNPEFKAYWPAGLTDEFPVLHDEEAGPSQPFPYCVFKISSPITESRMSTTDKKVRKEIRTISVSFKVYSREIKGTGKSAKVLASELAAKIIKIFGGHPTTPPISLTLEHGAVIQSTYRDDYSLRLDDLIFLWNIDYDFLVDVPVTDY